MISLRFSVHHWQQIELRRPITLTTVLDRFGAGKEARTGMRNPFSGLEDLTDLALLLFLIRLLGGPPTPQILFIQYRLTGLCFLLRASSRGGSFRFRPLRLQIFDSEQNRPSR